MSTRTKSIIWVLVLLRPFEVHALAVASNLEDAFCATCSSGAYDAELFADSMEDSLNLLQRHVSLIVQKDGKKHEIKRVSPSIAATSMLSSAWPVELWTWLSAAPGMVTQQPCPIMSLQECLRMERWPLLMLLILALVSIPFLRHVMGVRNIAEQATFCTYIVQVTNFISFTLVITTSYLMAVMVGADIAFSGAIIGFYMTGSGLGFFISWALLMQCPNLWRSHPRLVLPLTLLLGLSGSIGYAAISFMVPLGVKVPLVVFRVTLLMTRALTGIGQGVAAMYVRVMNVRLTPAEHRMAQGVNFQFSISLGMGLGPFLSALASLDSREQNGPNGNSILLQHVGVLGVGLQLMALVIILQLLPDVAECADQVALQDGGQDCGKQTQQATKNTKLGAEDVVEKDKVEQTEADATVFWQKREIVIVCLVSLVLNSYTAAALESLTSLVLRVSFGWQTLKIGIAVALTFLMTVPLRLGSKYFTPQSMHWKRVVCLSFHLILLLGGLFVFLSSVFDSMPLLLLSDALIFPSIVMITGMMVGQMDMFRFPDTSWFNVNTRTLISGLLTNSFARSLGPIAATSIFQRSGQLGYALQQGFCILLMIGLFLRIYNMFGYSRAGLDDEDKPESPRESAPASAAALLDCSNQ